MSITGPINPRIRQWAQVQRVLSSSGINSLLSVPSRAVPDEPTAQRDEADRPRLLEPIGLQQAEIREKEEHADENQEKCADGPRTFCLDKRPWICLSGAPSFGHAVRVDWHVAIETTKSNAQERDVSAGHVAADSGDEAAEDEHLDQRLDVFAVVDRAEARNKAERRSEGRICVRARRCRRVGIRGAERTCEQTCETVLAVERAANFARAFRAKRFAAIAAIAGGFAVGVHGAGH